MTTTRTTASTGRSEAAGEPQPIFVAGRWETSRERLVVPNPADPERPAGQTYLASAAQLEAATEAAVATFRERGAGPVYERAEVLRAISTGVLEQRDELARLMTLEVGKPIRDTRLEAERTALAFRLASGEAERIHGELIPLDVFPSSKGRVGITSRFPIGPVAAISPFNLPLGLSVHKLAPAIAAGDPIVLRTPSKAPLALLALARIIESAGAPAGSVSIMPMTRTLGDRMVEDDRFRLLTFTGSPAVGWDMKRRAGRKKVLLELGGNAAAIIDRSADIERAASRCVTGAFKFAGQLCVSIQRLLVHEAIAEPFLDRFIELAAALRLGNPLDETTDVGPMIDQAAIERTSRLIDEAVIAGARVLHGGHARGRFFEPTILAGVPATLPVCSDEAFAPIVIIQPFSDFGTALETVNASRFGLQAGIFTNDLEHAWRAYQRLEVGAVIVNDIPSYRIDHMPFGGVKESGLGREGLRWAIEEMTEPRLLVLA
jgi:acyl-CoA reductase-like NAD-dependent aldehyde dehydrogenase